MNQDTATTTNVAYSLSDPAGRGAFTYMVMYSVRAQSSRYIGLSRSSDTMPHRTTKCSFPVSPLRSHSFSSPFSFTLTFSSCLFSSSCFLLPPAPLHPPRYSYTLFDIAASRARVPLGRYSHCMLCRHTATHGRSSMREEKRKSGRDGDTHTHTYI